MKEATGPSAAARTRNLHLRRVALYPVELPTGTTATVYPFLMKFLLALMLLPGCVTVHEWKGCAAEGIDVTQCEEQILLFQKRNPWDLRYIARCNGMRWCGLVPIGP